MIIPKQSTATFFALFQKFVLLFQGVIITIQCSNVVYKCVSNQELNLYVTSIF